MLSEHAICELLSGLLPSGRLNECFESDAEVITWNGVRGLFTTDEFSAEDLFRESDPYRLGANIAIGAISDILACGGTPLYYAHALTVDPRWDADYLRQFGSGVRDVLLATGARFIGGDCGRSTTWRCTVSVLGSCEAQPVQRRGVVPGDSIYLSGPVGAGNLEAALRWREAGSGPTFPAPDAETLQNRFTLRRKESALLRRYASAAMDTSDGLGAALHTLADLNQCGYAVANLPYLPTALRYFGLASLPKTLLFLGECGEYELLLAIPPDREAAFLAEGRSVGCTFHRLGRFTPAGRVLSEDGRTLDLSSWHSQAREFTDPQAYLRAMLCWLEQARSGTGNAGQNHGADPESPAPPPERGCPHPQQPTEPARVTSAPLAEPLPPPRVRTPALRSASGRPQPNAANPTEGS